MKQPLGGAEGGSSAGAKPKEVEVVSPYPCNLID
jgi:hypothetical protein